MVSNLAEIPTLTRDKQLAHVDVRAALFKRDNGMALSLAEIAVVSGYNYLEIRRMKLPLFHAKISWPDFLAEKRRRLTAVAEGSPPPLSEGPATRARRRRRAADKSGESPRSRDSLAASQSAPVSANGDTR